MKIVIPAKEAEVCDLCGRDSVLSECAVCGRDYCWPCEGLVPGCIHRMGICRQCADRKDVQVVARRFAPRLQRVLRARFDALAALPKDGGCDAD